MAKGDLIFSKRQMNAAGMLGFALDVNAPVPWQDFGAFITNPVSLRPRVAAESTCLLEYAGGFLLHTGLPNPGFGAVVTKYGRRWADSPLPIIVHLMADRPEETREMVQGLEGMENVMAVELGFAPLLADDIILLAVEMSRGELPLMVCLPGEQVLRLGTRALQLGATALSLATPRGTISRNGRSFSGRLFGPSLFPAALGLVYSSAAVGLPTIGAGGVFSQRDADAMVAAGAIGVQLDAQLWHPKG